MIKEVNRLREKKMNDYDPDTERACAYCIHSSPLDDEDSVLCRKKGVIAADFCCRKFRYDVLKRRPRKVPLPEIDPEDLLL
jgi:hypothetical protein